MEPDYDRAIELFQLAAAQGDGKSANYIGVLHQLGLGAEQDLGKAMEYYEKAGDLGYSGGYKTLAVMYDLGSEVEPDPAKAAEFYLKAADLGDADACCQIAAMYAGGSSVEQDAGKAAEYYQKAADLGMVQALYTLGMMYYTGDGAEQDFTKAVTYFTQAAEQEDPTAMFALGECLRLGQGTEKDPGKAAEWYRKALEDGYAPNEEEKEMLKAALGEAYDLFFPVPEEGKDYFVRTAAVLTGEEQVGSMDLRFYLSAPHVPCYGLKDYVNFMYQTGFYLSAPHVPCYGLKDYVNFMYQTGLTVTPPQDGTVWEVANPNGTKILVDPSAGKIEAADWARFQMPPAPYTTQVGVKDSPCAWTYYSEIGFDDPPAPVTFDFAKYGIAVYADEEDVYLPLELLSAMFTDIACNDVLWNGETVLKPKMDMETLGTVPDEWYESKYRSGLLTGKRQREEDVIREDYAELCFTLDYFYGHPGPALLESGLSEKGLDAALDDIPELSSVKERLMSPDMVEYMLALNDLFNIGLNEGHCMYFGLNGVSEADFPYPELAKKIAGRSQSNFQLKSIGLQQVDAEVRKARQAAWGDEVYRECGSTAILRIDEFYYDVAGWEAYYAGKGEIPMDAVGITWTGLKRASENPAIKNILFDLSANSGGSSDMLMYMMDLMFGEKIFRGYNVLTKQREHAVVHSDKNLDGVFDEKDEEVKYDCFNYAVLTARGSFSCGNLMPFVMQEHGAVLLGEPTGGGSCCVQLVTLTSGGEGMISSWLWALRDENGESVEGGCKTDLPIARIEPETPTNEDPRLSAGDYTPFFDDVMLDRMINEWFEEQALSPAA